MDIFTSIFHPKLRLFPNYDPYEGFLLLETTCPGVLAGLPARKESCKKHGTRFWIPVNIQGHPRWLPSAAHEGEEVLYNDVRCVLYNDARCVDVLYNDGRCVDPDGTSECLYVNVETIAPIEGRRVSLTKLGQLRKDNA